MITLPILLREFRITSRRKRTFILRFVFGGLMALMSLFFLLAEMVSRNSQAVGLALLQTLAWQMFILLFILAPALTCGCISDERKQGTLGLLFLTHLNAADVVLGKFIGKACDVLLLVLAATPLLFVPILLGGVGWDQTIAIVVDIAALLLMTLSVGVFCSTVAPSTTLAVTFAYVGLVLYNVAVCMLPQLKSLPLSPGKLAIVSLIPDWLMLASPFYALNGVRLHNVCISLACNGALAAMLLMFCIWRLPRSLYKMSFREPFWRTLGRWFAAFSRIGGKSRPHPRRAIGNPTFWLYFGRSKSRWWVQGLTVLGIMGFAIWAYIHEPFRTSRTEWMTAMYYVGMIATFCIKILIVLYVARSFVSQKEDGSLELLLSTPTSNRQIVHGKLLAVVGHYGLLFGLGFGLMVAGIWGGEMGRGGGSFYFLTQLATTASGIVALVLVCMLMSVWSRSLTQAVLLCIVGTLLVSWFLSIATSIATLMVGIGAYAASRGRGIETQRILQASVMGVRVLIDVVVAFIAYRLLILKLRVYAAR